MMVKFNISDLINIGDLILLSFSLTIPTVLYLFEAKKNINRNVNSLSLCRYLYLFIICRQVLFYVLVRTHEAKILTNLFLTIIIVSVSIYICRYFVFCIFINSIGEGEH